MSVELGQIIEGKYRITRLIGRGGMGAVYEGLNERIDRRVAIKVLLPSEDQTAARRFELEARAAGRIGNDHILEVLDIGALPDGSQYMVMEFLDGEPFSACLQRNGRLAAEQLAPILLQLLEGLEAAHRAGITHRDLKPDNIFLVREKAGRADFVKLIDFGISKFSPLAGGDDFSMTKTGMMMGTPYYLSPEQARGQGTIDHRADIYAVGVISFEALTGNVPFQAEAFNDLLFKIVLEEPPPIEKLLPELDPAFADIVKKAMARQADQRFSSSAEFRNAILTWANERGLAVAAPQSTQPQLSRPPAHSSGSFETFDQASRTAPVPVLTQPTPAAFGTTAQQQGVSSAPLASKRNILIGAGALAVVLVAALALALSSGSSDEPATAAASPAPEIIPTADPAFASPERTAEKAPAVPPTLAPDATAPTPDSEPAAVTADTQASAAKAARTAKTTTTSAPAASAPSAAPAASSQAKKKKMYFGY
ncbi:MAG TPA: serine/threonine-protein kinase [Polyangiaceae bacterium]|nr:serine/threonine-protein kinase [Polyangiaceae bacterium]